MIIWFWSMYSSSVTLYMAMVSCSPVSEVNLHDVSALVTSLRKASPHC